MSDLVKKVIKTIKNCDVKCAQVIIAAVREHDGWVSVEDRLPETSRGTRSKAVLIYCPVIKCTFTACYNFDEKGWEHFASGANNLNEHVSHWMPLPNPPRIEGVEE